MTLPSSAIIIIIVVGFALYLIYSQNQMQYLQQPPYMQHSCPQCRYQQQGSMGGMALKSQWDASQTAPQQPAQQPQPRPQPAPQLAPQPAPLPALPLVPQQPQVTNVVIDNDTDPYSDGIKRQDLYTMYDPLTYPQLRLPREVLDRYNEYYERTGTYPPFNQATQPYLFDNPILNGVLIKQVEENEPFNDNIPNSVPLFRVKSVKNANRYFYYVIDQRYLSKIEPKIPLDHVRINGIRYNNADYYGIPELFDGDCVEDINIYPGARFKTSLYKSYHFP